MSHHRNPRALLAPAMRQVLDRMARSARTPLHALTPAQARAFYEAGADVLDLPSPKLCRVEDRHIVTRDGHSMKARLYATSAEPLPTLLYLHGGGFTIGSIATHDILCRHLSHLARCTVVSLDYRLAPEHRFPTAANDAWDALRWLHMHGQEWGLDATRLAVGGDSAGGTLAAVSAIEARNAGIPLMLQLLFYPGTCARQDTASHHTFAHGFVLEGTHIQWMFSHYLNQESDRDDWRFAPLDGVDEHGHTVDLDGVAPAWMGLAECDPLVDEGVAYADRLRLARVPVDLDIYRGVVHEFIKMGRAIPLALQAHADAARALRRAFGIEA